jgi:hypothetical protein
MRLRYRAQALSDIDAIHGYLDERSPPGARSVLQAIYASINLSRSIRRHINGPTIPISACMWCGAIATRFSTASPLTRSKLSLQA